MSNSYIGDTSSRRGIMGFSKIWNVGLTLESFPACFPSAVKEIGYKQNAADGSVPSKSE